RLGFHGNVELGILQRGRFNLRVYPVFDEPGNGRESEMPAPSGFHHVSITKSNSTRSIAAHPCKGRKDGAPPVGMMHARAIEGRPLAGMKRYIHAYGVARGL